MPDEIMPCPFERRIIGGHGAVLLRRNKEHAAHCAKAIQRRSHPAWSRFNCDFTVKQGAAA